MAEFEPLNPKKLPHLNHPICEKMPGKYERIGREIGKLVDKKNWAYGDAFNKSDEFLKLLYPNGVRPEQYGDMLAIVRVFDKLMRIANRKNAFGENPWNDVAGYGILQSDDEEQQIRLYPDYLSDEEREQLWKEYLGVAGYGISQSDGEKQEK